MIRRRRPALVLALAALPGCAALASWDGFAGVPPTDDAGRRADASEKEDPDEAAARPDGGGMIPDATTGGIVVVQTASAGVEIKRTAMDVDLASPERAGDTLIVAVGWYDLTSDATVTDTRGNTFVKAIGPTRINGNRDAVAQSIYFAANIKPAAAGLDRIHVAFSSTDGMGAESPDVRVAEIAGLKGTPPFVLATEKTGSTAVLASAPTTVTAAPALLLGAATTSAEFDACAPDFDHPCLLSPQTNIVGFRLVSAGGAYTMTPAAFPRSEDWVLQLAVFR